jgi:hypothetical protein
MSINSPRAAEGCESADIVRGPSADCSSDKDIDWDSDDSSLASVLHIWSFSAKLAMLFFRRVLPAGVFGVAPSLQKAQGSEKAVATASSQQFLFYLPLVHRKGKVM